MKPNAFHELTSDMTPSRLAISSPTAFRLSCTCQSLTRCARGSESISISSSWLRGLRSLQANASLRVASDINAPHFPNVFVLPAISLNESFMMFIDRNSFSTYDEKYGESALKLFSTSIASGGGVSAVVDAVDILSVHFTAPSGNRFCSYEALAVSIPSCTRMFVSVVSHLEDDDDGARRFSLVVVETPPAYQLKVFLFI